MLLLRYYWDVVVRAHEQYRSPWLPWENKYGAPLGGSANTGCEYYQVFFEPLPAISNFYCNNYPCHWWMVMVIVTRHRQILLGNFWATFSIFLATFTKMTIFDIPVFCHFKSNTEPKILLYFTLYLGVLWCILHIWMSRWMSCGISSVYGRLVGYPALIFQI